MNNDSALRALSSFLIATAVFFSYLAPLAADPRALAKRLDIRVIQSGHSLTDPIPPKLIAMVRAMGVHAPVIARSTIPGSPMDFRWNNPPHPSLPDARATIGNYDVLVITERISLSGTMPWHKSEVQALQWFNHAWTKGNGGKGAETLLYATWVEITSGPNNKNPYRDPEGHIPWRERLPMEMARWEQIADYVNKNRPDGAPAMRIIPGPLIMAAMHDAILRREAPGLTAVSNLFSDDIHLSDVGAYLIALAHYAVIYARDPRELAGRIGSDARPELAAFMQNLVWTVVTGYGRTGLRKPG